LIKKVVFILKAGNSSGLGHLSRCLSLANTIESIGYGSNLRVISDGDDTALVHLEKEGYTNYFLYTNMTSLIQAISSEDEFKSIVYVKDYYGVDNKIEELFKVKQAKWVEFDYKFDRDFYNADFIINGNPGIFKSNYLNKIKISTKLLIGLNYSIISDEVSNLKNQRTPLDHNVLISMGGGEMPKNVVDFIGNIINSQEYIFHIQTNDQNVLNLVRNNHNVYLITDRKSLINSYNNCKYAIVAGGVTSHEMAYLGVKMLFYPFSENHLKNVKSWSELNFGTKYSDKVNFSESIQSLDKLEPCVKLDGKGGFRIAKAILNLNKK
jgi:spore coat polysaccharide biosynthesis predicted glycosyltransferase SpsG